MRLTQYIDEERERLHRRGNHTLAAAPTSRLGEAPASVAGTKAPSPPINAPIECQQRRYCARSAPERDYLEGDKAGVLTSSVRKSGWTRRHAIG